MEVAVDAMKFAMAVLNEPWQTFESLNLAKDATGRDDKIITFHSLECYLLQEEQRMKT